MRLWDLPYLRDDTRVIGFGVNLSRYHRKGKSKDLIISIVILKWYIRYVDIFNFETGILHLQGNTSSYNKLKPNDSKVIFPDNFEKYQFKYIWLILEKNIKQNTLTLWVRSKTTQTYKHQN